jgi:hypothetical protein
MVMVSTIAKFTIEAYGQKQQIELYSFDGKAKHHRELGHSIKEQERATGEEILRVLDEMHQKSLLLPTAGEGDERRRSD